MLTITALTNGEYLISSVALTIDEYYAGVGESPGVWAGKWAATLGLSGMVEADQLRGLVEGRHPTSAEELLTGHRPRSVRAFDLTFSAPKSVSLLWALGSAPVAEVVAGAHREAVDVALGFLEERAAVARIQTDGVRRRVPARGWVVAGFSHRTSREGDPQLHTHCLVPNVVQRAGDGRFVALDAGPLHDWCRAAGSVYQNELQRLLSLRLGVVWGPDRNNTREMVGFSRPQLRAFSKRGAQIEAELEAQGAVYESPALRMAADDAASLATRAAKDHSLTPTLLSDRWHTEAAVVGLAVGADVDRAVCWGEPDLTPPTWEQVAEALVDEETGLCARSARFTQADVVEHVCALSGGRMALTDVTAMAERFLASGLAVRLVPEVDGGRRRPAEWSTAAHRALEDDTVALLEALAARPAVPVAAGAVSSAVAADPRLGPDQVDAVGALTGAGGSLRAVLAPAGYGKTAMAHAAAAAAGLDGRAVVAVATTAKAVSELAGAGLPARTIAQLRVDLTTGGLEPGTVVILDEISQTSTRDAHIVLAAVAACPNSMLWVLGDPRQSRPVAAGGIADEIGRLADASIIPAGQLAVNRRQVEPADREALDLLRRGRADESQELRTGQGWEHEHANPWATREAMADAVSAGVRSRGAGEVVALTVSHADAEDLADRIRGRLTAAGMLSGPVLVGPGWAGEREYRAGDRVLLHARCGPRADGLVNGTTATVERVERDGLAVRLDNGIDTVLPAEFVTGARRDASPNLSHGWARTVDGAQGGTWESCHLLGSSALDALRGYSGQSRSRQPTHTWNTAQVAVVDHGGVLADQRGPAEQVAAALARIPDTRLAARSDPFSVDRQLAEQIRAHQAVLEPQPPDRGGALVAAGDELARARSYQANRQAMVVGATESLDQLGPRSGLTTRGRQQRRDLVTRLADNVDGAQQARSATAVAAAKLGRLHLEQAAHDIFEQAEGWRRGEIDRLGERRDQHWAEVILRCVLAGDPLAFGIDKLRHARRIVARDLRALDARIPLDRGPELLQARAEVTAAVNARREAGDALASAQTRLDDARRTKRGRRDHQGIAGATSQVSTAQRRLDGSRNTEAAARERLSDLAGHQQLRRQILAENHPRRAQLKGAIEDFDRALDATRPERVNALAADPAAHLIQLLGPVPHTATDRDLWCSRAEKIEAHLDKAQPEGAAWRRLRREVGAVRAGLEEPQEPAIRPGGDAAARRDPASRPEWFPPHQTVDRGGPGLGL